MFKDIDNGIEIKLWVQPRASKNKVIGPYSDSLKISITAPPVDGKANTEIIKFFSKALKISKSSIEILSGATGRNKRIKILGFTQDEFKEKLGID
jgi:uncharacterized protein (TIGR00251 family)